MLSDVECEKYRKSTFIFSTTASWCKRPLVSRIIHFKDRVAIANTARRSLQQGCETRRLMIGDRRSREIMGIGTLVELQASNASASIDRTRLPRKFPQRYRGKFSNETSIIFTILESPVESVDCRNWIPYSGAVKQTSWNFDRSSR